MQTSSNLSDVDEHDVVPVQRNAEQPLDAHLRLEAERAVTQADYGRHEALLDPLLMLMLPRRRIAPARLLLVRHADPQCSYQFTGHICTSRNSRCTNAL